MLMLIPKTAYLLGPELEAGVHPHLALGVLVLVHPLLAVGRLVLGLLDDLQVVLGVVGELLPQQPLFALLLRLPRLATLGLLLPSEDATLLDAGQCSAVLSQRC